MDIGSISHKALKRFFLTGNSKGLGGDVERLRAMLAFIAAAASLDDLATPPNYGLHRLTGNRAGTWSMAVTRNWRLTFTVTEMATIVDLNLEDYHGS
jgi:toxin HigB-1